MSLPESCRVMTTFQIVAVYVLILPRWDSRGSHACIAKFYVDTLVHRDPTLSEQTNPYILVQQTVF